MADEDEGRPYVVQPRDTVLTIALMHDLPLQALLDANAAMLEDRDAQMLAPGEILLLPPPPPPVQAVSPQVRNRFVARRPRVHLHLVFEDEAGPMADETFRVPGEVRLPGERGGRGPKEPLESVLDGEGAITLVAPALIGSFVLTFPERYVDHVIEVGGLDPVDARAGRAARLRHRGFLPVDQMLANPYRFESKTSERKTLEAFQRAYDLSPTGFADGPTQERLVEENGC